MGWINLMQDVDGWLAVVGAVMNLRFSSNAGNLHATRDEELLAYQEGHRSVKYL